MSIKLGDVLFYNTSTRGEQMGVLTDIVKVVSSKNYQEGTIILLVKPQQENLDIDAITTMQITGRYRKF